jgi:hypothetical protein
VLYGPGTAENAAEAPAALSVSLRTKRRIPGFPGTARQKGSISVSALYRTEGASARAREQLFERRSLSFLCPARDGRNFERRSLSGRMSCADGGQEGPAPLVNLPAHGREKGSALLSPPRPSHSSQKASRELCSASRNMQKRSRWDLFWPHGSDQDAHIMDARTDSEKINCTIAHILRFKPTCRPNHTIENRSGCILIILLYFNQNRARESMVPNPYMRVSISAVRPKNVPQGLFRMFRLAPPVRAMPWGDESILTARANCSIYHIAKVDSHGGPGLLANQSAMRWCPPCRRPRRTYNGLQRRSLCFLTEQEKPRILRFARNNEALHTFHSLASL